MPHKNSSNELDFFQHYDRFINDMRTGKKRLISGNVYKPSTLKVYQHVRNNLIAFSTEQNFSMRLVKTKRLNQRQMVKEKNYWKRFYRRFTDFMHTRGLHDNYVGIHMKAIRAFFNYLKYDLLIEVFDFKRQLYVSKEEIPVVIVTPERLQFLIHNKEFEATLPGRLKRIKDTFVLGCTIALRYSDLMALTQSNILKVDSHYYLSVRSKKTKTFSRVRLPDYAIEIIKRNKKHGPGLVPDISKFNMNKYLKELAELAGWTEPLAKYREKRGKAKEIKLNGETFRLCDHISSHTMRRTGITTMLTLGVPEHIVRSISGHSPMSKEFFKYVGIAQVYKDREIDKLHEKLKMAS